MWQQWAHIPVISSQQELNSSCLCSWDMEQLGMHSAASNRGITHRDIYCLLKEPEGRFWGLIQEL